MSDATLRSALPPIYRRLLPALFDLQPPAEEKATCSNCAMCPPRGVEPPEGVTFFRPDTKCCTYHPTLPNYLVGAVLADSDPGLDEGKRRLRQKIAGRTGVLPRWIAAPRKFRLLFDHSRERSFGRALSLRCPYYIEEGGLCAVWRHREADCSTFFCKYDAGADGQAFWRQLGGYLTQLELALTRHALSQVAPGLEELPQPKGQLTLEELEDRPPLASLYEAAWGDWLGREAELYLACHEVIAALAPEALPGLLDAEHAERLARLGEAHARATRPRLPERLVLSADLGFNPVEGGAVVVGYSRYEPMFLSEPLLEVLRVFQPGETLAATRARLQREHEVELPDELLLSLHHTRILVEP